MRTRTQEEKAVLGKVEVIMRNLCIKKTTRGYSPLLDIIAYAYAYPEKDILDIVEYLSGENSYVGVFLDVEDGDEKNVDNRIFPAMIRTIETAIERADNEYLKVLKLDKLKLILDEHSDEELISEIGTKYEQYEHDEKILVYFVKKVLKKCNA